MNRREFFCFSGMVPFLGLPKSPGLREVFVWEQEPRGWRRVRLYSVRKGDIFTMEESGRPLGVFKATSDAFEMDGGVWAIEHRNLDDKIFSRLPDS